MKKLFLALLAVFSIALVVAAVAATANQPLTAAIKRWC